jgi:hypothetical protein
LRRHEITGHSSNGVTFRFLRELADEMDEFFTGSVANHVGVSKTIFIRMINGGKLGLENFVNLLVRHCFAQRGRRPVRAESPPCDSLG